jgi:beta-galactosidase
MAEASSSAPPKETSLLLSIDGDDPKKEEKGQQHRIRNWFSERTCHPTVSCWFGWVAFGVASAFILVTAVMFRRAPAPVQSNTITIPSEYHTFPSDFVWGTATSSYQIEGAVKDDGRGESIWDVFSHVPGNTVNNGTGDVTCDHYHRMEEDVALMKSLNVKAYRFSISWSRILPNGVGALNPPGIQFYSRLIDMLLANGIEPWVTLFHWDLPQSLEDEYGGWLDIRTSEAFAEYARICFEQFGGRVKHWITLNESWTVSVAGYNNGVHAPGHKDKPTTEPYIVGHHLLLAHAKAARIYKQHFAPEQKGIIGISNCGDFRYPLAADNDADKQAAERAMLFQFGWFVDPILLGDYPAVMRKQLGDRLPHFTPEEQQDLLGSADFLGLNYYSALLAAAPKKKPTFGGYWADMFVDFSNDPIWEQNEMGWNVVPDGLGQMLWWISKRYDNPLIFITENGAAFDEPDLAAATHDEDRRGYFEGHLRACAEAIEAGVNLAGYFAWSLLDNFEWQYSYTKRFGLCYVDFDTLERTPKLSGRWYRDTIRDNGHNIAKGVSNLTFVGTRRSLVESSLPKAP